MTNETLGGLKRLSYGDHTLGILAGQPKYDVDITGGSIANVTLTDATIVGVDTMVFDPTAQAYLRGRLYYDSANECLTFYNNDSNISLQIGQEMWVRVQNVSGSTIANGAAVTISGASGSLPTITLAQSNANIICLGLATEAIGNNTSGWVTISGRVNGVDTSAFAAGATVYVSSATPGALVTTRPVSPNYAIRLGVVGGSNVSTGTILVNSPTTALGFGAANQLFGMNSGATGQEYKTLSTGTAGTDFAIANTANTVTFNIPDAGASARGLITNGAQTIAGAKTFSTAIAATSGGTGQSTYAVGDFLVGGASNTLTKLADVATGSALISGGVGVAPSYGKIGLATHVSGTLPAGNGGTGVANASTITIAGNLTHAGAFTQTFTATGNTSVTLPTSGTLYGTATGSITSAQLSASLSDETGSGSAVFATSPTLVTPVLGAATATSINFGGSTLSTNVDNTSWTPVFSGLTIVGTPTYTATYNRIGNTVECWLTISSTTTTASNNATTSFTGLPFLPRQASVCMAVNGANNTSYGNGLVQTSGTVNTPTWAATALVQIYFSYPV